MKKNNINIQEIAIVWIVFVFVCAGYGRFYNNAFSGYDARGNHIWLSASTVKFVNNWLKEGPLRLKFIMYEYPDSIEFKSLVERMAYISYPPGTIIPPYILAKLLGKNEIQVGFIKQFLKIKFLFDTLMVCLIIYSILRRTLRLNSRTMPAAVSIIFSLCWMCLPNNLYYLRNVYFSDQCIITIVLVFVLLEIYDNYFSKKSTRTFLRYFYFSLKFLVSLFGVLTDWYFLFVLLVSWLIKIVPLFKTKKAIKNILLSSAIYVFPVFLGIGLFILQIITIPGFENIILRKIKYRTFDTSVIQGNKLLVVAKHFISAYSIGFCFIAALVILSLYVFIKNLKNKMFLKEYKSLFDIILLICVPPFLQVLVLQQHSAVHEFSMLKFALPIICSFVLLPVMLLDLKGLKKAKFAVLLENNNESKKIFISVLFLCFIFSSILVFGMVNANTDYYISRMGISESYERENLIRSNYDYNDVYFSFTESIEGNPPQYLAISKKLIHKINNVSDIDILFPSLSIGARILLVVNKDNAYKSPEIIEKEQTVLQDARLVFSSENYGVYEIHNLLGVPLR
jgi:hypothetical protein